MSLYGTVVKLLEIQPVAALPWLPSTMAYTAQSFWNSAAKMLSGIKFASSGGNRNRTTPKP
jgi:hypothetical protein